MTRKLQEIVDYLRQESRILSTRHDFQNMIYKIIVDHVSGNSILIFVTTDKFLEIVDNDNMLKLCQVP